MFKHYVNNSRCFNKNLIKFHEASGQFHYQETVCNRFEEFKTQNHFDYFDLMTI